MLEADRSELDELAHGSLNQDEVKYRQMLRERVKRNRSELTSSMLSIEKHLAELAPQETHDAS